MMRNDRRAVSPRIAGIVLILFVSPVATNAVDAQESVRKSESISVFLGRDSCAANTCHGGPIGQNVDWNCSLTVFEAHDPHGRAGIALTSELTQMIVESLEPRARKSDFRSQRNEQQAKFYRDTLVNRCAGCHAPAASRLRANEIDQGLNRAIVEGVSCESCHGAATTWLQPHLLADWKRRDGMAETEDYVERIEGCVRCHVGSRRADGLIRDMNHDMIAAGHPALRFDAWAYNQSLPPHWDESAKASPDGKDVSTHQQRFRLGRLVSLRGATRLTLQRIDDSRGGGDAFWPELADFDCYACHQELRIGAAEGSTAPLSPGFPDYNPWLEAGMLELSIRPRGNPEADKKYAAMLDDLRMRPAGELRVRSAARLMEDAILNPLIAAEQAGRIASPTGRPIVAFQQPSSIPAMYQNESAGQSTDWHDAAVWFLRTQAVIFDHRESIDPRILRALTLLGRKLDFQDAEMNAAGKSPAGPENFDVEQFRRWAEQFAIAYPVEQ
jgi:hypothetical protein